MKKSLVKKSNLKETDNIKQVLSQFGITVKGEKHATIKVDVAQPEEKVITLSDIIH